MTAPTWNRRDFVRSLALAGSTIAVGGTIASCDDPTGAPGAALPKRGGNTVTPRYPLRVPSVVSPNGLTLSAAPGNVEILPGVQTPAWMYNGQFPGPTIQTTSGGPFAIRNVDGLPQPTITHWHGLLTDSANDGHPHQAVQPGLYYDYALVVNQRAGLHWYHPHPHGHTGEQVYRGLAGAFIVRDAVDTGLPGNPLGLPVGAYELPLIIRDVSLDSRGGFQFSNKSSGFWGNTPLVNGTYKPYHDVHRGVYRFRLLNGCNARVLRLALSSGQAFTLIGNDGGLLDTAVSVTELVAAPGERFDVLVDFRGLASGATVVLRDVDAGWDILEFRGTGVAGAGTLVSGSLSTIPPLGSPVRQRTFTFDGMTRINGKVYDLNAVEFSVPFGDVERWKFITNGNGPHPVHVHGVHFQVQSRTGGRGQTYEWERGWKDTVLVNDGETVEVLIRFTAHRGLYVMHCHQLAHEDAGMMANFTVV
jgi:FtsP/CotA-like multicopper oxidase with cupredoxin domain